MHLFANNVPNPKIQLKTSKSGRYTFVYEQECPQAVTDEKLCLNLMSPQGPLIKDSEDNCEINYFKL